MALSSFHNLERKSQASDELYAEYRAFMVAYIKLVHMHLATMTSDYDLEWFHRFSSLIRLQRLISYMYRFID